MSYIRICDGVIFGIVLGVSVSLAFMHSYQVETTK
jgi:hypothetical protein